MVEELRAFPERYPGTAKQLFRVGVSAGLEPLPAWKRDADFLFVQVGFSVEAFTRWRTSIEFDGPVYAGVMVVPSVGMARKIGTEISQLAVPDTWVRAIDADSNAGVRLACDLVVDLRETGLFDGAHLIPVSKYRELASDLERRLS
jgi:5,10-methylenetetrahydrofolate reductase